MVNKQITLHVMTLHDSIVLTPDAGQVGKLTAEELEETEAELRKMLNEVADHFVHKPNTPVLRSKVISMLQRRLTEWAKQRKLSYIDVVLEDGEAMPNDSIDSVEKDIFDILTKVEVETYEKVRGQGGQGAPLSALNKVRERLQIYFEKKRT